jgi:serine/threonine-protein kinase RIO1
MRIDHNQRIGFGRYRKTAHGREERRFSRHSKVKLQEVRIVEAKKQLLSINEIKRVLTVIGGGKEATVLLAENKHNELVCAKVFRYFTSTIKKRMRGTKHLLASDMANLAAKQEYWNLSGMSNYVPVPKPILLHNNVVIMDFISKGDESEKPAPLLREINLGRKEAEEMLYEAIDILADLFLKAKFIHGDYSEHNLMVTNGSTLLTMDVSQSVQYNTKTFIDTPIRIRIDKALDYLEKDIKIINKYFQRIYRMSINPTEVRDAIINELPNKLKEFIWERTMEIYPSALYSPDVIAGKEKYRDDIFYQRTGAFRQKPK